MTTKPLAICKSINELNVFKQKIYHKMLSILLYKSMRLRRVTTGFIFLQQVKINILSITNMINKINFTC